MSLSLSNSGKLYFFTSFIIGMIDLATSFIDCNDRFSKEYYLRINDQQSVSDNFGIGTCEDPFTTSLSMITAA